MGFAIMLLGVNALIYLFLGAFTVIPVLFSLAFYAAVVNFFRYTERKHTDGDREVVCMATPLDHSKLTSSVKDSGM